MNWFISKCARIFNGIIAGAIVSIGLIGAFGALEKFDSLSSPYLSRPLYAILIILGTIILATLICGIIAILSQIQFNLEELNNKTGNPNNYPLKD